MDLSYVIFGIALGVIGVLLLRYLRQILDRIFDKWKPSQANPFYECPYCPPHTGMDPKKVHRLVRIYSDDDEEVGIDERDKGTAVAAEYCKKHCPGGCMSGCKKRPSGERVEVTQT